MRERKRQGDDTRPRAEDPQTILVFLSVTFDAIALILVSLAQSPQAAIVAFGVFALGSGDAPTYKSVFVAAVPERHASESRASQAQPGQHGPVSLLLHGRVGTLNRTRRARAHEVDWGARGVGLSLRASLLTLAEPSQVKRSLR